MSRNPADAPQAQPTSRSPCQSFSCTCRTTTLLLMSGAPVTVGGLFVRGWAREHEPGEENPEQQDGQQGESFELECIQPEV